MAYDLNPNDVSVMGDWSFDNGTLSFKGSDEELQLKALPKGAKKGKKGFLMEFRHKNKKRKFAALKNPTVLFGWDEGLAAVVVNHEEQY